MDAVRKLAIVKDHKLTLDLPDDFNHKHVEVIVLACEPSVIAQDTIAETWEEDFLTISCWDDSEDAESLSSWHLKSF